MNESSYWYPAHYVVSAWHEHAPFASWVIDVLRPKTVVELGTHNGFSFFVFCEAAKRLGLSTELYALDSWEGDDQAGFYGQSVFESVSEVVASEYSDHAHLLKGYFSDSVSCFEDGTIDLLHIDGRHGYEDVAEDFAAYLPKLSPRAVVLFHDTNEFQDGFGVHRFWGELAARYPSFQFLHGHGLGVLAVGRSIPPAIAALLNEARTSTDSIRHSYEVLGRAVSRQFVLEVEHFRLIHELRLRVVELEQQMHGVGARLEETSRELENAEKTVREIRGSASWRVSAPLRAVSSLIHRHP